jgi:hypothetical protein
VADRTDEGELIHIIDPAEHGDASQLAAAKLQLIPEGCHRDEPKFRVPLHLANGPVTFLSRTNNHVWVAEQAAPY